MPKKSILMEIEALVYKNNELFDELTATKRKYDDSKALVATLLQRTDDLQREVEEKNGVISQLQAELEALRVEADATEPEDCVVLDSVIESPLCDDDDSACVDDSVAEACSGVCIAEEPESVAAAIAEADYGAAVELASAAIGEVVLQCTELCAFFAENGGSNAKDLINLALGRTEVFKGEALSIVEELSDTAAVVSKLNEKKSSTLDYFAILKKQV